MPGSSLWTRWVLLLALRRCNALMLTYYYWPDYSSQLTRNAHYRFPHIWRANIYHTISLGYTAASTGVISGKRVRLDRQTLSLPYYSATIMSLRFSRNADTINLSLISDCPGSITPIRYTVAYFHSLRERFLRFSCWLDKSANAKKKKKRKKTGKNVSSTVPVQGILSPVTVSIKSILAWDREKKKTDAIAQSVECEIWV